MLLIMLNVCNVRCMQRFKKEKKKFARCMQQVVV
jgi:hypothetical protein